MAEGVSVKVTTSPPSISPIDGTTDDVTEAIKLALSRLKGVVWDFEHIEHFVDCCVAQKLKGTPPQDIQSPACSITGPIVEALRFSLQDEGQDGALCQEGTQKDLLASLLACALDRETAHLAHPSFVETIKQITSDEVKLLRHIVHPGEHRQVPLVDVAYLPKFQSYYQVHTSKISLLGEEAGCQHRRSTPTYLDNLVHLGLVEIMHLPPNNLPETHHALLHHPEVAAATRQVHQLGREAEVIALLAQGTRLGEQFVVACIKEHQVVRHALLGSK